MRRIKIDANLKCRVDSFCDNMFSERGFTKPIEGLEILKKKYRKERRAYIQKIIDEYTNILKATPQEMLNYISSFNTILSYNSFPLDFSKKIVLAMRYEDLREKEYLEFAQDLKYNSCVYCNAQLANVINLEYYKKDFNNGIVFRKEGDIKRRKANFELDHFHAKSKYPFLCTSFYNLIPSCSSCNKSKSDKDALFMLYTEDDNLDVFKFELDEEVELKYWEHQKTETIQFKFKLAKEESLITEDDQDLYNNHSEFFRIQELYETQIDIVEELLHKSKAYREAYNRHLVKDFKELFPNKDVIERLLVSNYTRPSDIHKRPMSKFTQDIARQLKLIK